MINVLYIGNALSKEDKTQTTIEILGAKLKEICEVKIASNKSNKVLRFCDMMWMVFKWRKSTDYVLIDTYSTLNFYYAVVVGFLCRVYKIKYIPILHGGNLEYRLKNNRTLSKSFFGNAHKLIAPSKFLYDIFKNNKFKNLEYIPNFIEIDKYDFNQREMDRIQLLWVRSFSSIYNPKLAVDVLEDLSNFDTNASLTMVGPDVDGSLNSVRQYAKGKNLNIEFTGKLSKEEWIALSKSHNIFLNTTNIDNTPVSVIEAMALGIPVVSTNVGGMPYLIENKEEGLLVDPNNREAITRAILVLKENSELLLKITQNAREKVELFDWDVVKSKWQVILQ
ncbi:glycosyltransferase family 4 protein [Winogradskyella poriferorum]|uniref:glycosyltransferase family 4 protein n=1 Tax=Winogradskyella poriferorum TaxID=307627 RepID=UPI003D6508ED